MTQFPQPIKAERIAVLTEFLKSFIVEVALEFPKASIVGQGSIILQARPLTSTLEGYAHVTVPSITGKLNAWLDEHAIRDCISNSIGPSGGMIIIYFTDGFKEEAAPEGTASAPA